MFKFGFSCDADEEEQKVEPPKVLEWVPAAKVEVSKSQIERKFTPEDYTKDTIACGCTLKVIKLDVALLDFHDGQDSIREAEAQHTDLIPALYEGGLKVWECTYDLAKYILEKDFELKDKVMLDLGCGTGIVGLTALSKGATVHFQDYNVEVLNATTIPNVILNSDSIENALERSEFYSGDWESFKSLSNTPDSGPRKYDFIFTSETIYNSDNHRKLYGVFKERLADNGVGLIAAKTYYFGVGGGMRSFQKLIDVDGCFDTEVVWTSQGGIQREILKICRTQQ